MDELLGAEIGVIQVGRFGNCRESEVGSPGSGKKQGPLTSEVVDLVFGQSDCVSDN